VSSAPTFTVDPRAPLFFLSYARVGKGRGIAAAQHDLNANTIRLFEDLSTHVGELIGRLPGTDPGFMDLSLGGGERWTPELLHAAGSCQIFIPLISPTLLNSRWCAMEWDLFSRRKVVRRDTGEPDHETAIIPVRWTPTHHNAEPAVVSSVQRFYPARIPDPKVAAQYEDEGVYGLLTLNLEAAYRAVVWRLAQRVVQIHRSHWVEPWVPAGTGELRNIFVEGR
jgi:hypothetical protein